MSPYWLAPLFVLFVGMAVGMVLFAFALAIADTRRERAWKRLKR